MIDPGINIAVQHLSPALTIFVIPGEFLDSTPWYLLIISVLCLGFHPRYGVRLAVLIGVTAGLNEALKLAWHLPRPYWISPDVKAFANHPSFGFPSGAAMYGAAAYGYIAAVVRRRRVVAACALLLVSTCFVRVIAGVHFVPDIFGGLLFGFLLLLLFFRAEPWITRYAGTLSRPGRCIWILILSAIPIVLVMPAYNALAGWELPGILGRDRLPADRLGDRPGHDPVCLGGCGYHPWKSRRLRSSPLAGRVGTAGRNRAKVRSYSCRIGIRACCMGDHCHNPGTICPPVSFRPGDFRMFHGSGIVLADLLRTPDCQESRVCAGGRAQGSGRGVRKPGIHTGSRRVPGCWRTGRYPIRHRIYPPSHSPRFSIEESEGLFEDLTVFSSLRSDDHRVLLLQVWRPAARRRLPAPGAPSGLSTPKSRY